MHVVKYIIGFVENCQSILSPLYAIYLLLLILSDLSVWKKKLHQRQCLYTGLHTEQKVAKFSKIQWHTYVIKFNSYIYNNVVNVTSVFTNNDSKLYNYASLNLCIHYSFNTCTVVNCGVNSSLIDIAYDSSSV